MDFSLTERQQAVAGLAAEVLGAADPWKELARAGLLDVSPPDGLGVLEVAVLLTEIGKRNPSMKALATLMTGALPVLRWGSAELKQALLPGVASGELLLAAALCEPSNPAPNPSGCSTAARRVTVPSPSSSPAWTGPATCRTSPP